MPVAVGKVSTGMEDLQANAVMAFTGNLPDPVCMLATEHSMPFFRSLGVTATPSNVGIASGLLLPKDNALRTRLRQCGLRSCNEGYRNE